MISVSNASRTIDDPSKNRRGTSSDLSSDHAREVTAAMHAAGHPRTVAVPAPVSGVHVVSYDGGPVG